MQYQILPINITITVWSVRRTNNEILGGVYGPVIIHRLRKGVGDFILIGGWGSHGFQGTRRGDQSLLAEYEEGHH